MAEFTKTDKQAEAENDFRSSLQDVLAVAKGMASYCQTVEDLIEVVRLATENEGQLRFVLRVVTAQKR